MGNIIEKITLYDILGYMLPGSILGFMAMAGIIFRYGNIFEEYRINNSGGVYFAFFLFSYLMGIVVSEISTLFFQKAGGWIKVHILKGTEDSKNEMEAIGITARELAEALYKSGRMEEKGEIQHKIESQGWKIYKQYMYGIIQCNEKYKRIHNYASMHILCKNMAMSLILGMAIMYCCGLQSKGFTAAVMISIVVLAARSQRFDRKKNEYTVMWFVNQFCAGMH